MNATSPVKMVRQVCESFHGETFTVHQAAKKMVELFPAASPHAFADGWEALLRARNLAHTQREPFHYWLEDSETSSRGG